ncbi:MAG: phosphoenolpyruvate carboxylase, partial [Chloroflexaceae bacterium]|nr:phosphoenolpyruvate carboxylase [Chloroflexaceae bacterium]
AATLGELLRGLDLDVNFARNSEEERRATLDRLLAEPRPAALAANAGITRDTAETWALFQLIARTRRIYGDALLGPFIISMTRGPADVLTVLLLAREFNGTAYTLLDVRGAALFGLLAGAALGLVWLLGGMMSRRDSS